MQFENAFTLKIVDSDKLEDCNFVLGVVPTLQKFSRDVSVTSDVRSACMTLFMCCTVAQAETKTRFSARDSHSLEVTLKELRQFVFDENDEYSKNKQKLLRNIHVSILG